MNIFEQIFKDPDYDQLNNIVRWNGLNRIKDESVAHHSFIVSWFSRIIVENLFPVGNYEMKLEVTTYAIFHDFDEMFSGDIVHSVKYNSFNGDKMRKLLDEYCNARTKEKFSGDSATDKLFRTYLDSGNINKTSKMIVKLADWLSMLFYIKKEIQLGNAGLFDQFTYCKEAMNKCVEDLHDRLDRIEPNWDNAILMEIKSINF